MAYSPTGITTSTTDLPATINKMPVDAAAMTAASIGGPHRPSTGPAAASSSRPPSRWHTTTSSSKPDLASSGSSSHSTTTATTLTAATARVQHLTEVKVPESPPMTSFLTDRFAASTLQESVYLSRVRHLRLATYLVSALIEGCALGSLGTAAHVLYVHHSTSSTNASFILSLWPTSLDLRPTLSTLVPAAMISLVVPSYILIAAIPSPHSRTRLLSYVCLLVTGLALILSLASLLFTTIVTYRADAHSGRPYAAHPTLLSFTCAYYRGPARFAAASKDLQLPLFSRFGYPRGFGRLCRETEAAWALMAGVVLLSLLGLGLVGLGFAAEVAIGRARTARYAEKYTDGVDEKAEAEAENAPAVTNASPSSSPLQQQQQHSAESV